MFFPSKKDSLFAVLIWGVIIFMAWQMIVEKSVMVYIIGGLTIIFFLWLWFGTRYQIEEELLTIKSGPFRSTVKIGEIRRLNASKTLLSGPALSIDRIEIHHHQYDIAIVSPKDKTAFVQALLANNKRIEVDDRLLND